MPTRRLVAVAALATLAVLAGCRSATPTATAADDVDGPYGAAPARAAGVTLQPDVVIVGGGSGSVRSVSADGLQWLIDGRAAHVRDLATGSVMFVTGRAVGRVLDIAERGPDRLVTIGPVDLTEVIRDGAFSQSDTVLGDPLIYTASQAFWAQDTMPSRTGPGRSAPRPAAVARDDQPPAPAPQRGTGTDADTWGFRIHATCCTNGVGAHFSYNQDGVRMAGTVTLTSSTPRASFNLTIRGGEVTAAGLTINGGFGLRVDFDAGIDQGQNIKKEFPIPAQFTFPIAPIAGIPLSFTVSQTMLIQTVFGGRVGTFSGHGEFSLAGSFGFGYANKSFGLSTVADVARKTSLLDSLSGTSVGAMGLLIGHNVRFTVGIGAHLFTAGIFFEVRTQFGTSIGSLLGAPLARCRGVGLGIYAAYGVGYQIPSYVTDAINGFLSLLRPLKPIKPIESSRSIGPAPSKLWTREEVTPDVALCGHTQITQP